MNKLLLLVTITVLSTNITYAKEDVWYLTADFGGAYISKTNEHNTGVKLKAKISPILSFGVGYGITNNFRATIDFTHYFTPELKRTIKFTKNGNDFDGTTKHKVQVDVLTLKAVVDLFEVDDFKFFAGAGVGVARLSEKTTATGSTTDLIKKETTEVTATSYRYNYVERTSSIKNVSVKARNKNNIAFTILTGSAYKLSDGINFDLTYSYNDFGKTKFKTRIQAHDLRAGVRFDI